VAEKIDFQWKKCASGVWGTKLNDYTGDTLLDIAGVNPRQDALNNMGDIEFPFKRNVEAEALTGCVVLRFPLEDAEKIYGLGLQFKNINLRNKVFHLKADHYGGEDNGRTHAPCPFYVSSKGYGVFINTLGFVTVYVGTTNRKDSPKSPEAKDRNNDKTWTAYPEAEYIEVVVEKEGVDVLVFGGPSIKDAVCRYNLYCGGGCLPPKWGLGIWKRVPSLYSDSQVLEVVKEYGNRDFPLDVIGLEPGWHSKSYPCTYEWDSERFPEPEKFCKKLGDKGIKVNLWENPYVSPDTSIYPQLFPLSGTHNVWCGIVPDYTLPEASDILKEQHRTSHVDKGVSGYKIDECDGYDRWLWPDHAEFPSGHTGGEMRQSYGLQLQKLTTEIFREKGIRTYGLVRASNSGGAPFPYVIYNDRYDFSEYITALSTSSFCGVLWTPEVRNAKTAEELVRRCQAVCFSPMAMINSWASQTELWSFPEAEDAVRYIMKLRKRLIPYLYTAFANYHFKGIPPFRAFAMDFNDFGTESENIGGVLDDTENPYAVAASKDITDQFMVGDFLMVAPIYPGKEEREVVLPSGEWYDFYSGESVGSRGIIMAAPGLNKIPLYVKDGGMIPMLAESGDSGLIEVYCYGHKSGKFELYEDDGITYAYEQGEYNQILLTSEIDNKGKPSGKAEIIRQKLASDFKDYKFLFMTR
jgi:Alpha-glucosidases, family 31 of glycosyl hydrolases